MATLRAKAEALGVVITKRKIAGDSYRVNCSVCPPEKFFTNQSAARIKAAMNDHARWHIEQAK